MNKITIVYYSGTGNTEMLAKAMEKGVKEAGSEVSLIQAEQASIDDVKNAGKIMLGCPASGAEALEESIFEPFFNSVKPELSGKSVALFGSFGWGGGQYMKDWEQTVKDTGAVLFEEGYVTLATPDEGSLLAAESFAKRFAK